MTGTKSSTRLSILIPSYNEERTIGLLLRAIFGTDLKPLGVEVEAIVVDDGSFDRTEELVRAEFPEVRYIRHPVNRGKGAAIRTAIAVAEGDIVLIQDADLEYAPSDYPALLAPILEGRARVVFGSRFMNTRYPKRMGFLHFIANHFLTTLTNVLFRVGLTDMATCYKVFRKEIIKGIPLDCEEFEFCPEITAKICRLGIPIHEVPIKYSARLPSEGKKIAWPDGIQALKTLFKYRFFSHDWKKRTKLEDSFASPSCDG